jgi:hypothetical protein
MKISISLPVAEAEILTQDLMNTKQESPDHDVLRSQQEFLETVT